MTLTAWKVFELFPTYYFFEITLILCLQAKPVKEQKYKKKDLNIQCKWFSTFMQYDNTDKMSQQK